MARGHGWDAHAFCCGLLQKLASRCPFLPERHPAPLVFLGPGRAITTSTVWKADVGAGEAPVLMASVAFPVRTAPPHSGVAASLCSDGYLLASPNMRLPTASSLRPPVLGCHSLSPRSTQEAVCSPQRAQQALAARSHRVLSVSLFALHTPCSQMFVLWLVSFSN